MGYDCRISIALCKVDSLESLSESTDLVDLDEDGVRNTLLKTHLKALGVGYEEVITDELNPVADPLGEKLPALPVILCHTILETQLSQSSTI